MATIGVMSSIPYEKPFQDALENNVNLPGVSFHHPAEDDAQDLVQAVKNLLAAKVDYIVTLGGYVAYDAAAKNSTVPFFSLAGEEPASPPKLCWGGVSLESWAHNKDRVEYLINTKKFNSKGAISLYYNHNSGIANDEVNDWKNSLYPNYTTAQNENILVQDPITAMKAQNDENDFDKTVDNITSSAVIISPDPFFHKKHDPLVRKLNKKINLFVCYPLQNYSAAKPNKGGGILYGPKLEEAITTLAGVITSAINAEKAAGFSKQSLGNPVPA